MGQDPRLKGQEVEVRIVRNGVPEVTISSIASFEDTAKFEKKEDGFLGESTNRYDEIYNGNDAKCDMHVNNYDWMKLQNAIKERAQRKTPGLVINIVRTDYYTNGQTAIITYPDVHFGPSTTSIGGRGEFVKVTLDFSCGERDDSLQNSVL